ncbi:unnamed protein product [Moneuplotes crassus]|uniref:Uncharacterized protein n=1 Tax=Euplotes crassus TaxID=5936 RepID=A0AAD1X589_EUPCR|nr:unnamed protein product [Moneuplotes crassus]
MGNTCCSCVRKYEVPLNREERQSQIERFRAIMCYDFNKGRRNEQTVEEAIMNKLTNDLGQPVVSHVCHILISEFRKFMFIIGEYNHYSTSPSAQSSIIDQSQAQLDPLLAPPVIDQIWCLLICMSSVYERFCKDIFGAYLHRKYFLGAESPDYECYSTTLDLCKKYMDIIHPYKSIWPDYNASCYFSDYFGTCYLPLSSINEVICDISDYNTNVLKTKITKAKLKNIVRHVSKKFTKKIVTKSCRIIKFSKGSITVDSYQEISVEKLFNKILNRLINFHPFTVKLQSKLLLDKSTCMAYITEYSKFLLLMVKNAKKCFPSATIETIWKCHYEFTDVYREFSQEYFGDIRHPPEEENCYSKINLKKYEFTLAEYERVFSKPESQIWEDAQDRFQPSDDNKVYVNLKKLCLAHSIRIFNPDFLCFPKQCMKTRV